jgi:hypothetical protein
MNKRSTSSSGGQPEQFEVTRMKPRSAGTLCGFGLGFPVPQKVSRKKINLINLINFRSPKSGEAANKLCQTMDAFKRSNRQNGKNSKKAKND